MEIVAACASFAALVIAWMGSPERRVRQGPETVGEYLRGAA